MIALLDNGQELEQCEREIGVQVGQLLTPLTRYTLRDPERTWAIDNGGFKNPEIAGLLSLLAREFHHKELCAFVAAPDVIGSARRTLEVFPFWRERLKVWKIALVCQDGQEDLPIPWDEIDAVFIGGSTNWKCGPYAKAICTAAKILGKWVHVGRINTPSRFEYFEELGADSFDGSGIARYTHMREAIANRGNQGRLLLHEHE